MSNQLLDYFNDFEDRFDPDARVVVLKFFNFESEARLYAARLKEAGIRSFISNANSHTVIPIGGGSIGLHIKEADLPGAQLIVRKLDAHNSKEPEHISFHDADQEDIAYERALHEKKSNKLDPVILIIATIILLLLAQLLLRGGSIIHPVWGWKVVEERAKEVIQIKTSTQETYQENKLMSGLALLKITTKQKVL